MCVTVGSPSGPLTLKVGGVVTSPEGEQCSHTVRRNLEEVLQDLGGDTEVGADHLKEVVRAYASGVTEGIGEEQRQGLGRFISG